MRNSRDYMDLLRQNLKQYTQLDDASIDSIIADIPVMEAERGTVLLQQGTAPEHSYYLLKGCIRQCACDENGKEATVDFYIEEDPVNMFSFLDDEGLSLYSLACLEDCCMVACSDTDADSAACDSEIDKMKLTMFQRQYSDMQRHYTAMKLMSPQERLEQLIKQRPQLLDRIPQIYLASYLGMTPETFSRIKKRIQR